MTRRTRLYIQEFTGIVQSTIETMFGVAYEPICDDTGEPVISESNSFQATQDSIVNITFVGSVSGDFFITVDSQEWLQVLSTITDNPKELEELSQSALKEVLNVVVGEAIQFLEADFPGLTFHCPRLIRGTLDYPEVASLHSTLVNKDYGKIEVILCLNRSRQTLDIQLEESIEKQILSEAETRKVESIMQSIMDNIDQGIFNMNIKDGRIQPGCSKFIEKLLFKKMNEIVDSLWIDIITPFIHESQRKEFCDWLKMLSSQSHEDAEDVSESSPIQQLKFFREGKNYLYKLSYFYIVRQGQTDLMVVIEDMTGQSELEVQLKLNRRMIDELKTARFAQDALFPQKDFSINGVTISGFYTRATECGGDWWHHFYDKHNDRFYVLIADATGHGVAAALITAIAKGSIESIASLLEQNPELAFTTADILSFFNAAIYNALEGHIYMTASACCFDFKENKIHFTNGNHPFPVQYTKNNIELFRENPLKKLVRNFLVMRSGFVGQNPNQEFTIAFTKLNPGDRFVFYTDGLIECQNPEGKDLGKMRLYRFLQESIDLSPSEAINYVMKESYRYLDGQPLEDDVTFVICEYNP